MVQEPGHHGRHAAFALCRDQKLPIKVFSIFKPGALKRVVLGEDEPWHAWSTFDEKT